MGNLFSSAPTQQESRTIFSQSYSDVEQVARQFRNLSLEHRQVQPNVSYNRQSVTTNRSSSISPGGSAVPTLTARGGTWVTARCRNPLSESKIVSRSDINCIMNFIQDYTITLNWDVRSYDHSRIHFVALDPNSYEYEEIMHLFNGSNKKCFKITHIERIQNPFLLAAFLLKKEEMTRRIGYIDVQELFHGTKGESVMSICGDNFDWRRYGQNVGNKFGQGISFTAISNYATHYADDTSNNRIMLLVHVLVGNEIVGTANMKLPPGGYDTSIKPDRHVTVKYEDNEFYPAYKITYECTNPMELLNRQPKKRNNQRRKARQQVVRQTYYDDEYDY